MDMILPAYKDDMKPVKTTSTRKKIILYFLFAIAAPSLVLGVLAFRGIQNDQALREKQQREKALDTSKQLSAVIDAYLTMAEDSLLNISFKNPNPGQTVFSDSAFDEFLNQFPSVSGVFFIDDKKTVYLLGTKLLYLDEYSYKESFEESLPEEELALEKGWVHEYQEKDIEKAIEYYKEIFNSLKTPISKAKALNSLARVQKKLGLFEDAIQSYSLIRQHYHELMLNHSLPFGLVAMHESSQMLMLKGDSIAAFTTALDIYRGFIEKQWKLNELNYTGFHARNQEFLDLFKQFQYGDWYSLQQERSRLESKLNTLQHCTEALLSMIDEAEELNALYENKKNNSNLQKTYRFENQYSGKSNLISMTEDRFGVTHCLLIDPSKLPEDFIDNELFKPFLQAKREFKLEDQNNKVIYISGILEDRELLVKQRLSEGLPQWTLSVYSKKENLLLFMFTSDQSIYFYIFLFIIIALGFGLYFTHKMIKQELQVSTLKSNFIDTVSHEFKSPITSIRQMSEMLFDNRVQKEDRKMEYYKSMQYQSERLSHLIDNIMDFSKLEKGKKKFHFESTNMKILMENVKRQFKRKAKAKGISLNVSLQDNLTEVELDQNSMEQVFYNLIENAFKYAIGTDRVDVSLYTNSEKLKIEVSDYGIGIPEHEHSKIFERFYRVEQHNEFHINGSGIGLNIVKEIITAHNGAINVSSTVGKGAKFQITLPLQQNNHS